MVQNLEIIAFVLVCFGILTSLFAFLDNFKWMARIKVALGFACFLESLHGQGLWIRNIDGVHIMVDKVGTESLTFLFLLSCVNNSSF